MQKKFSLDRWKDMNLFPRLRLISQDEILLKNRVIPTSPPSAATRSRHTVLSVYRASVNRL